MHLSYWQLSFRRARTAPGSLFTEQFTGTATVISAGCTNMNREGNGNVLMSTAPEIRAGMHPFALRRLELYFKPDFKPTNRKQH